MCKQDTLSSTQLNAVNSGITSAKVTTYDGYASTIANKVDTSYLTSNYYTSSVVDAKINAVSSGYVKNTIINEANCYLDWRATASGAQAPYISLRDTATTNNYRVNLTSEGLLVAYSTDTSAEIITQYKYDCIRYGSGVTLTLPTLSGTLATREWVESYIDPSDYYTKAQINTSLNDKQDTLVSGTNLKTVGGVSLLGSGDIPIALTENVVYKTTNNGESGNGSVVRINTSYGDANQDFGVVVQDWPPASRLNYSSLDLSKSGLAITIVSGVRTTTIDNYIDSDDNLQYLRITREAGVTTTTSDILDESMIATTAEIDALFN